MAASVDGRLRQASDIFQADPGISDRSLLAADPTAAAAVDDERGRPPLLYASYSRWHLIDPGRAG